MVLSVVVLVAVAAFILLFERRRATRIERDLREMRDARRDQGGDGDVPRDPPVR